MKKDKIIYWTTTGLFSLFMLFSAFGYFTMDEMKEAFVHLGFPDYFRIQLGTAKVLGALALILPFVPKPFKIFAYVGFTINLFSAIIAHIAVGDPISGLLSIVFALVLLGVSYFTYTKLQAHTTQ
ncbi:MAG: DoxX-like family protein [Bacteroidia bacterium 44-10]|nr:MAG: DoxX-like family protein [Bacteroidia bacterium 44-10]